MPSINPITTTAGRAAILAGVAAPSTVVVEDVQLSDVDQAVTVATTALTDVVATLEATGAVRVAGSGHALHVVMTDDSSAAYDVRAFALRLTGGAFLMVYSQAGLIATKVAGSSLHLALDLTVDADTAATLDFGDTDYALPAGGESAPGLLELATTAEVLAGADTVRAVTPAGLAALTATDARAGLVELATDAEVITGTDTTRAVTIASLVARTATDARVGLVELATDAEAVTGSDAARAVTPAALAAKLDDVCTGPRKILVSPVVFAGQAGVVYDPGGDYAQITAGNTVCCQLSGILPDGSTVAQIRMDVTKGNTSGTTITGRRRDPFASMPTPEFVDFGTAASSVLGDQIMDTGDTSGDPDAVLDVGSFIHEVTFSAASGTTDTIHWIEISYIRAFDGKL